MTKTIVSIGYDIPGHEEIKINYKSKKSLMDSDIVLFSPDLPYYEKTSSGGGYYQGKICYGESGSFDLKENISHWKKEISSSLASGKTVFFLLDEKEEYFVDTGNRTYTGNGRNRNTTINVALSNNYEVLPIKIGNTHVAQGKEVLSVGQIYFKEFFQYFSSYLEYKVYIQNIEDSVILFTGKDKTKVLGSYFKVGEGHLVLLPSIKYDEDKFTQKKKNAKGEIEDYWTEKALEFGNVLLANLFRIDKALRVEVDDIPPPIWATQDEFKNSKERKIEGDLVQKEDMIKDVERDILSLRVELKNEQILKGLLFEQGKALENSVLKALHTLGYSAENYDDGELELDQIILSPEGYRYIGECEGKDEKDIDISKFRQLLESMSADFSREEVKEKAFGILFGNPQRLMSPEDRTLDFTEKCKIGANREKIALIRTVDLFHVASYLSQNTDSKFQKKCRDVIHKSLGKIVDFPPIPVKKLKD